MDPNAIVKQLKGISGPNPTWEGGRLILSTPDAIGKALDDYLKENRAENINGPVKEKVRITMAQENSVQENSYECKDCGTSSNVVNEGGCLTCRECGWSKCD